MNFKRISERGLLEDGGLSGRGGGGRGNSHIKLTGLIFGNFEKNKNKKVPETRFVSVAHINFLPLKRDFS